MNLFDQVLFKHSQMLNDIENFLTSAPSYVSCADIKTLADKVDDLFKRQLNEGLYLGVKVTIHEYHYNVTLKNGSI